MDLSFLGGAALGMGSSLINNALGRSNAREAAEYNSPKNQVSRLREAGLSPWLINGASSNMTPATVNPTDLAGSASNVANAKTSAKVADAQVRKTNQETEQSKDMFQFLLDMARSNARKSSADADIADAHASTEPMRIQIQMHKEQFDALKSEYDASTAKAMSEVTTALKDVNIETAQKSLEELKEKIKGLKSDNEIKEVASDIAKKYGILPTDDGFKALMHLVLSEKGDELLAKLAQIIPTLAGSLVDNGFDAVVNTGKTLYDKGKTLYDKGKSYLGFHN